MFFCCFFFCFFPKAILFIIPNTFTAYSTKITLTFTLAMYLHFLQYNTNATKKNTIILQYNYLQIDIDYNLQKQYITMYYMT